MEQLISIALKFHRAGSEFVVRLDMAEILKSLRGFITLEEFRSLSDQSGGGRLFFKKNLPIPVLVNPPTQEQDANGNRQGQQQLHIRDRRNLRPKVPITILRTLTAFRSR
jgi:hypothetical protein